MSRIILDMDLIKLFFLLLSCSDIEKSLRQFLVESQASLWYNDFTKGKPRCNKGELSVVGDARLYFLSSSFFTRSIPRWTTSVLLICSFSEQYSSFFSISLDNRTLSRWFFELSDFGLGDMLFSLLSCTYVYYITVHTRCQGLSIEKTPFKRSV